MSDTGYTGSQLVDAVLTISGGSNRSDALSTAAEGYRRFLSGYDDINQRSHRWRFLEALGTLAIGGTRSLVINSTPVGITATTGQFDRSMIGQPLQINGVDISTKIESVTDATHATLSTPIGTMTGLSATIVSGIYDLPADFSALSAINYAHAAYNNKPALELTDALTLLQMYQQSAVLGVPYRYSVIAADFDAEVGQRWRLMLAPLPRETMTLLYSYRTAAPDLADNDNYTIGGADVAYAIISCVRAAAELKSGRVEGPFEDRARRAIAAAIDIDRARRPAGGVMSMR